MSKPYGHIEWEYAEPFARGLEVDLAFRKWLLRKTEFEEFADARLMNEEMKARRSKSAKTWWGSHYTESCRCEGCKGKETDLLAVFEASSGFRFALHVEVKQPTDSFKKDGVQSAGYPIRATCWATKAPRAIVPHQRGSTMVLFSERRAAQYGSQIHNFATRLTFETIEAAFPRFFNTKIE